MLIGISYIFLIGCFCLIGYLLTQFASTKHSSDMKVGLWLMTVILIGIMLGGTYNLFTLAINNMTN